MDIPEVVKVMQIGETISVVSGGITEIWQRTSETEFWVANYGIPHHAARKVTIEAQQVDDTPGGAKTDDTLEDNAFDADGSYCYGEPTIAVRLDDAQRILDREIRRAQDQSLVTLLNQFADRVYQTAEDKGFGKLDDMVNMLIADNPHLEPLADMLVSQRLLLIVTEIAELTEELRKGEREDAKVPGFTTRDTEAADILIRLLDTCKRHGIRLVEAALAKSDYNDTRPTMNGGKRF